MSDPAVDQLHQGGAYDYSHPGRLDNNGGVRDGAPYHHQNLHNTNNNNPWNDDTTPLMNNDGVVAHTNNSNHPTPINRGKQASNRASGARGVMVGGGGGKLPKDLNMHKLFGAVKQTIGGGGGGNNNNNIHGGGGIWGVHSLAHHVDFASNCRLTTGKCNSNKVLPLEFEHGYHNSYTYNCQQRWGYVLFNSVAGSGFYQWTLPLR